MGLTSEPFRLKYQEDVLLLVRDARREDRQINAPASSTDLDPKLDLNILGRVSVLFNQASRPSPPDGFFGPIEAKLPSDKAADLASWDELDNIGKVVTSNDLHAPLRGPLEGGRNVPAAKVGRA